jgi:branched-chain amino acid transport system substrate-binding protein
MIQSDLIEPKRVTLTIKSKSAKSLSIGLSIRSANTNLLVDRIEDRLLPLPRQELLDAYTAWQNSYLAWGGRHRFWQRSIKVTNDEPMETNVATPAETNASIPNAINLRNRLIEEFNTWLSMSISPDLFTIRESLIDRIPTQQYRDRPELLSIIIQTITEDEELDLILQRLPWNEWQFIHSRYGDNQGIALSTRDAPNVAQPTSGLKALVIIGSYNELGDRGIDLNPDLDALRQNLGEIVELEIWPSLESPESNTRLDLLQKLAQETYHLVFFCGHSLNCQIYLNDNEYISMDDIQFRNILTGLKTRGLLLLLFNSCSGLRIARTGMSVGVPYVIVMKELVHDRVAQNFIKYFLEEAIKPGIPIHIAFNIARRKLQWLKGLPHGEFLPVLFQNPEQQIFCINPTPALIIKKPLRWRESIKKTGKVIGLNRKIILSIFLSIVTLIAVFLVRQFLSSQTPTATACDSTVKTSPYLSCGEKSVLDYQDIDRQGKQGMDELNLESPNYKTAIENLESSWKNSKRNPEILIALSNAKIKLSQQQAIEKGKTINVKTIAVTIPVQDIKLEQRYLPISLLNAVAEAQRAWNEKPNKLNEWLLEVMIANDRNSPEFARTVVDNIVKKPTITGVTGSYSSFVTNAVLPLYRTYQLTLISGTNTATNLGEGNPFFLRVVSSNDIEAEQIIKFLNKNNIRDVELLHGSKIYAKTFKKALEDKAGNIHFHSVLLTDQKLNANNLFKNLKNNKSKILILLPDALIDPIDRENVHLVLQENTHPEFQIPIVGNELVNEPWLYNQILKQKELGQNLILITPWNCAIDKEHCSEIYKQKSPEWWRDDNKQISHRTVLTYDATNVLIDSIDLGITTGMSDRDIRSQLPHLIRKTTHNGMTGTISFKEDSNNRMQDLQGLAQPQFDRERKLIGFKVPDLKYQNNKSE